ncbi:unnamed protein product, partial [Brassica oleracea]
GELPFTSACHVITAGEGGSATSALSHTFDYLRKAFIVCGLGLAFSDFGVYVGIFFNFGPATTPLLQRRLLKRN